VNIKHQFPNAFILLGGDCNSPGINWSNGTLLESYLSVTSREALLQFSNDLYLDQIVLQPTRANNILGLCFTSYPDKIEWCNTLPGLSNHEAVHVRFSANLHKGKHLPKKVYMYRNADWESLKERINCVSEQYYQLNLDLLIKIGATSTMSCLKLYRTLFQQDCCLTDRIYLGCQV